MSVGEERAMEALQRWVLSARTSQSLRAIIADVVREAITEQREADAKIADEMYAGWGDHEACRMASTNISSAIRSQGIANPKSDA